MHHLPAHEALVLLEAHPDRGLTEREAELRLRRHGPNVLPRIERRGALFRLALQFHHPLIYVLLAAAAVTFAVGQPVDGSVVLGVVIANAIVGFLQEARAEGALDALTAMVTTDATVVRDGTSRRIAARDLVPGDVVQISPGDKVTADMRILAVEGLTIDESALTGESVPVVKAQDVLPPETLLADRANMAFSGTLVTRGLGRGVVVATGADTELGLIHRLLGETADLATPLTRRLTRFSKTLTIVILGLAALTFGVGLARGESASEMLVAAVALAVGAIPEGLPAAVTIALAIGVSRMAQRHAIVRRLPAVETLGSTTVICTDKTGTLTQNEMTVQTIIAGGREFDVDGVGYAPRGSVTSAGRAVSPDEHPALMTCLRAGVLCGDGDIAEHDAHWDAIGDPTEACLVTAGAKAGIDRTAELAAHPRLRELPFDSERRYMATLHRTPAGAEVMVKGAVERVLEMSTTQIAADGSVEPLDAAAILHDTHRLAERGLRVLALAVAHAAGNGDDLDLEHLRGLRFAGLQAMVDPPRPEAITAVKACLDAGIAVKMITGDHAATATAIAQRVGLAGKQAPTVVSGADLDAWPDDEVGERAAATHVFARVSAEQKLRLVEALQARGEVVAMTGDGVNDAPALSQADIGIAMGAGGTEVARESADIVLTDDNFASIEAAVEEGRHTFDNLRKFLVWTIPTNGGEGLLILAAILAGVTLPILPVQILWINMTTAVLLGLTLAFERAEPGIMQRAPRRPDEPLLTREVLRRIVVASVLLLIGSFALFEYEEQRGVPIDEARTVAVNLFIAVEVLYLFSCRSLTGRARDLGLFSNRWLIAGVAVMIVLQLAFTYWPPMNDLFGSAPLDLAIWAKIWAVALAAWVVIEIEKHIQRQGRRSRPRAARAQDAPASATRLGA